MSYWNQWEEASRDICELERGALALKACRARVEDYLDEASRERLRWFVREYYHWLGYFGGVEKAIPAVAGLQEKLRAPLQSCPAPDSGRRTGAASPAPTDPAGLRAEQVALVAEFLRWLASGQDTSAAPPDATATDAKFTRIRDLLFGPLPQGTR